MQALALRDRAYDFRALLKHDPDSTRALPPRWDKMDEPCALFADICQLAQRDSLDDLAGAAEDPASR